MFSAPTRMAPAPSSRSISVASRGAGGASRLIFEPASVGMPAMSNRFFTANGTPASAGAGSPRARASSSAWARASARCSVTAVKELSNGSRARIRAQRRFNDVQRAGAAGADCRGNVRRGLPGKSNATVSSTEHRRRLAFVRQRERVDQRCVGEKQLQIAPHPVVPGRIEWHARDLRARRDLSRDGIGLFSALRTRRRLTRRPAVALPALALRLSICASCDRNFPMISSKPLIPENCYMRLQGRQGAVKGRRGPQ